VPTFAGEKYATRVANPGRVVEVTRDDNPVIAIHADPTKGMISFTSSASDTGPGSSSLPSDMPTGCAHALRDGLTQSLKWLESEGGDASSG
jgi:hypothetical protein